jgi:hypothetical protein
LDLIFRRDSLGKKGRSMAFNSNKQMPALRSPLSIFTENISYFLDSRMIPDAGCQCQCQCQYPGRAH